jgi:hypothetical protein
MRLARLLPTIPIRPLACRKPLRWLKVVTGVVGHWQQCRLFNRRWNAEYRCRFLLVPEMQGNPRCAYPPGPQRQHERPGSGTANKRYSA